MAERAISRIRGAAPALAALWWLASLASPALAHDGPPPTPSGIWTAWTFDPVILLALVVAVACYVPGVVAVWRRAGTGRGIARWRVAAWLCGMLALITALVSPIDALGSALFAGHMVQHLLLVLVAAPLLVLGAPELAVVWSMPVPMRRRVGRWWVCSPVARTIRRVLGNAAVATILHAVAMWAWHAPMLYEAALWHDGWHALEHASFFLTALLFWWVVLRRRRRAGIAVLALFITAMQSGILGAFLSLSSSAWYLGHGATVGQWGLTLLEDQQLAGLIMWIPASVVYIVAALAVLWQWLEGGRPSVAFAGGSVAPARPADA